MVLMDSEVDEKVLDENHASHLASIKHSMKYGRRAKPVPAVLSEGQTVDDLWESYSFAADPAAGEALYGRDALPHAPFGVADMARVSRQPLFTAAECEAVIAEAEAEPRWREAGRIAFYARKAGSTRQLESLPAACAWFGDQFDQVLIPAIASAFPLALQDAELRVADARLVKYNASAGQIALGVHRDGPTLTATIALNPLACYEGGGTHIEALTGHASGHVLKCDVGHVLLHPGILRHSGAP
jgi:hypothetical protein